MIGQLVEMVRAMLTEPVQLLPDVPEVLEAVGRTHRLVLITKGDLIHQTAKVESSGLAHHFEQIEIVMEKDAETYARIIEPDRRAADRFCMVGNSVKSDILPVLALGGSAVHVPYHLLWDLEQAPDDHGHDVRRAGVARRAAGAGCASPRRRSADQGVHHCSRRVISPPS